MGRDATTTPRLSLTGLRNPATRKPKDTAAVPQALGGAESTPQEAAPVEMQITSETSRKELSSALKEHQPDTTLTSDQSKRNQAPKRRGRARAKPRFTFRCSDAVYALLAEQAEAWDCTLNYALIRLIRERAPALGAGAAERPHPRSGVDPKKLALALALVEQLE